MKKNILLGTVGLAIVAAGAWYFIPQGTIPKGVRETGNGMATGKRSMKDLLASGQNQKCTFSGGVENSNTSGTVYFSGNKMRGDFDSMNQGQNVKSHMIMMENTSYIWSSGSRDGMKMMMDAGAGAETQQQQSAVDYNAVADYSCDSWNADVSVFMPPNDVTFTDLNAMMKNIPTGMPVVR